MRLLKLSIWTLISCALISPAFADQRKPEGVASKGPGPMMLSLNEYGRLSHWQQVRYVYYFRQLLKEANDSQKGLGFKSAGLGQKKTELWALFLGNESFAEDDLFRRGSSGPEYCIYAATLSSYSQTGGKSFGCQRPPSCGAGKVTCGFVGSGLPEGQNCVAVTLSRSDQRPKHYDTTLLCTLRADELAKKNRAEIQQLLTQYQAEAAKGLSVESKKTWSDKLYQYAYDPEVFASLMDMAARESRAGKSLEGRLSAFNGYQDMVSASKNFFGFRSYCDKKLAPEVIEAMKSASQRCGAAKCSGNDYKDTEALSWFECPRLKAQGQEDSPEYKKAFYCANRNKDHFYSADTPMTVGNSVQRWECRNMMERADKVQTAFDSINGLVQPQAPVTENPPAPAPAPAPVVVAPPPAPIPSPAPPPPPVAAAEPENWEQDIQCGNAEKSDLVSNQNEDLILDNAASCMTCWASASVVQNPDISGEVKSSYRGGVSKKWVALLNIMSRACGDASKFTNNPNKTDPRTILRYLQTFGHCDQGTYNWGSWMKPVDRKKVRDWQANQIDWKKAEKDEDFEKIFGKPLDYMKEAFCDQEEKKKASDNLNDPFDTAKMATLRKQMYDNRKKDPLRPFSSDSDEKPNLVACMEKAHYVAETAYSWKENSQASSCTDFVETRDTRVNGQYSAASSHQAVPMMAIENRNICFVSRSMKVKDGTMTARMIIPDPNPAYDKVQDRNFMVSGWQSGSQAGKGPFEKVSIKAPWACPRTSGKYKMPSDAGKGKTAR